MSCVRARSPLSDLAAGLEHPKSAAPRARRRRQDIAMEVDDVRADYAAAVARGAKSVMPPTLGGRFGVYEIATIRSYGDTTHTFINRDRYRGIFAPGYQPIDPERYSPRPKPVGLVAIDHIVGNVEEGKMNEWVSSTQRAGLHSVRQLRRQGHQHGYSALMSKVVQSGTGRIKFPINEPASRKRQIADRGVSELLPRPRCAAHRHDYGQHHRDREAMRANDVSFLRVPQAYYDTLPERVGEIERGHPRTGRLGHPRGPRRRGLHAANLHQAGGRPSDAVLRDHPATRVEEFRQGELQGVFEAIDASRNDEELYN